MTITDWIQAISGWIAFGATVLVLIYYIIEAIEAFRKRTATFVVLVGLLLIIYLAFNTRNLQPADQVQIMLLLALLAVTGIYANANVKMAEEMRGQRYDTVRPVIDFQWQNFKEVTDDGQGGRVRESYREVPPELYCNLCNIGVGPAIDLYSFTKNGEDNHHKFDFGTLKAGGQTRVVPLSVVEKGSIGVLEACYKDIYGRVFKSKLEVYLVTGQGLSATLRVEKDQE